MEDLAKAVGFEVDTPERYAYQALAPAGPDGKWIGLETGLLAGRQNIKTGAVEVRVLHDLFVRQVPRVVWTAHLFKASREAFGDFVRIIESNDWLAREVLSIRIANGQESIETRTGRLDFLARSGKSGRAMKANTVVIDESLYATAVMTGALYPVLSTVENAHIIHASSPCIVTSEVLRKIRKKGRSGTARRLGFADFTTEGPNGERPPCLRVDCSHLPGSDNCALDDETLWPFANPALGRRITADYVRDERASSMPVSEFMRERMGWHEDPPETDGDERPVDPDRWAELADPGAVLPSDAHIVYTIDTSWDRQVSWVVVTGLLPGGKAFTQIAAYNFGTEWVMPWLAERIGKPGSKLLAIGWQRSGAPVSSLTEALDQRIPEELRRSLTGVEVAAASGYLHDLVKTGNVVHIGQEHMRVAVAGGKWRDLGDTRVIDRKASETDAAPLVATAEGAWLLSVTPPPSAGDIQRIR